MYHDTAPFAPDLRIRDRLMAIARWAVVADGDAAIRANTDKDFGELLQNDEPLIEALCGVEPLI